MSVEAPLFADKKVENLYLTAGGKLKKIELKDSKEKPIAFKAGVRLSSGRGACLYLPPRLASSLDKFYDPTLRGMDWKGYGDRLRPFPSAYQQQF